LPCSSRRSRINPFGFPFTSGLSTIHSAGSFSSSRHVPIRSLLGSAFSILPTGSVTGTQPAERNTNEKITRNWRDMIGAPEM
jgi:hypothetical protein